MKLWQVGILVLLIVGVFVFLKHNDMKEYRERDQLMQKQILEMQDEIEIKNLEIGELNMQIGRLKDSVSVREKIIYQNKVILKEKTNEIRNSSSDSNYRFVIEYLHNR